jgi:hypothetical protein
LDVGFLVVGFDVGLLVGLLVDIAHWNVTLVKEEKACTAA